MRRYKIVIEYDGRPFVGWQRQKNGIAVQHRIEDALKLFTQEEISIIGAGRTDTGVHATGQTAHFDINRKLDPYRIIMALNAHLRDDPICIVDAEEVDQDFHARFSAKSRSYRYIVLNRCAPAGLERDRVYHVPHKLNLEAMQQAANLLIGRHDFSTFRAHACQARGPIKTLTSFDVSQSGDYFFFDVSALSFLHHQVRNMVGSLVYVGKGKWSVDDFKRAFEERRRCSGGPTAPPQGLYFKEVRY